MKYFKKTAVVISFILLSLLFSIGAVTENNESETPKVTLEACRLAHQAR